MRTSYIVKLIEFKGKLCLPIPKQLGKDLGIKVGTRVSLELMPDNKTILLRKVD